MSAHILIDDALEILKHAASAQEEVVIVQRMITQFLVDQSLTLKEFDTTAHASPYLVHRKPDRLKQKQAQTKDHWTKVEERYLTRAFQEAREAANCYSGWKEE